MANANRSAKGRYKILMVAPTSFFSDYGCSVRILEEAQVLQRLGNQVTICTYRNGQDVTGLTIHRTPNIPFREHYEVGSSPHKIAFDFLLFWTVLRAALRLRPDVIHGHMHEGALIGLVVGWLLGIPLVFDFQGSLTSEMVDHKFLKRKSLSYHLLHWLEKRINCAAPAIVTSSDNARNLLLDEYGCQSERVTTVPDCVDAERFKPPGPDQETRNDTLRTNLSIPDGRAVVAYLGLLADYQGTDVLLHAAARVVQQRRDVHFLIMGFPHIEYYQDMAQRLGIGNHTTFTGKVPYQQAPEYLALGQVAVAPKLSATEGSGKLLNYMAMALPVVTFDTPVSREYLGDKAIYATPGDADSLARGLLHGLSSPEARCDGQCLRATAARAYSWDLAAKAILATYDSVCHGS